MGARTFDAKQLSAMGGISLDSFATWLGCCLRLQRTAIESTQTLLAPLVLQMVSSRGSTLTAEFQPGAGWDPACEEEALLMQQESRLPRSTGSLIRLCISEAVSLLELNDPSHFNALSMEMASDMQAAVMWLASQEEGAFKSLVVQGAGDHFCPGGNMHRMKRADARSAPSLAAVARGSIDLFDGFCQLRALPVPVTCAVHGAVLGGGLAVCLLTDHVTCDNAATFQVACLVL